MKKGKVFGKSQVVAFLMILCLGGAVWLNMRFSSTEKYLGETSYVDKSTSKTVATNAKANEEKSDYFSEAKQSRQKMLTEAEETVKELLKTDKLSDEDKKSATESVKKIAQRLESANNIETLVKAKGFKNAVAVISDKGISLVVKSDGLTTAQTLQIQEIITTEADISLADIKIVTVK